MGTFIKDNIAYEANKKNLALVCANNQFLCNKQGEVIFELEALLAYDEPVNYSLVSLGMWQNHPVYLVILDYAFNIQPNTYWQTLRYIIQDVTAELFKLLSYASQLNTWLKDYQYCGRCGSKTHYDNKQHLITCSNCRNIIYPRQNPCMIVLITRDDEILLAHSPRYKSKKMYSTLAGFVEAGESIEECVHREVKEEVNLKVHNLRYITSQSWPFPHSFMLGFHAEYLSGDIILQPEEIEDAKWFSIKKLPELSPKHAISRYLIDLYVAERLGTNKPSLPY